MSRMPFDTLRRLIGVCVATCTTCEVLDSGAARRAMVGVVVPEMLISTAGIGCPMLHQGTILGRWTPPGSFVTRLTIVLQIAQPSRVQNCAGRGKDEWRRWPAQFHRPPDRIKFFCDFLPSDAVV